jgi:hypothetical protein
MKRILFLFFCFPTFIFAQGWEKVIGGQDDDYGNSVQQTNDGGYIVSGGTESFGNGESDVYLIKTDSNGDTLWSKTYGGIDFEDSFSVQQTSDGGYIMTGIAFSFSFGNAQADVYLIKTDSNGDSIWTKTYGEMNYSYGSYVQQTSDGGYIITGATGFEDETDVFLIKTDINGDTLWTNTFGGASMDVGNSVEQTDDGGYVILGSTSSFADTISDLYLVKTDASGNEQWYQTFGGQGYSYDFGNSVQQTTDGGFIITGYTYITGSSYDVYLIKTDASGVDQWQQTYGSTDKDYGYFVQQTSEGGFIITGNTKSFGNDYEVYLIKTDELGIEEWQQTYGGTDKDYGKSVKQVIGGGYILVGVTKSFGDSRQVYLINTDSIGTSFTIFGCTNLFACNYDSIANVDDGSCLTNFGCTDSFACNYDVFATCDDGSCLTNFGCTDSFACNYDSFATCDNGSCLTNFGCTDSFACNYDSFATCDDGSCLTNFGCTNLFACNYDSLATCDDGSCLTIYGCLNIAAVNYDPLANCSDTCIFLNVDFGCTDTSALNYNPLAIIDDNSCIYCLYGCTNSLACNYDAFATCDDGSCFDNIELQQNATLCYGEGFLVGVNLYSNSGNFTDTLISSSGCDSIVYTSISVLPTLGLQQSVEICNGTYVFVGNSVYNVQGSYVDVFTALNGCDSTVYTNIVVNENITSYSFDTMNISSSIVWNELTIFESGNYMDILINSDGCDSIANLNITFNINTNVTNFINNRKKLVRIVDILGREIIFTRNVPQFYIYDDGTVVKKIVF